jgi:hypothetical protein
MNSPWIAGWAALCFAGAPSAGPRLCFAGAGAVGAGAGRDRDLRVLDRPETATISAAKNDEKHDETDWNWPVHCQFIRKKITWDPWTVYSSGLFLDVFLTVPFWGTGSGCPGGPIAQGDRDRSRHCRGGHQWRQCRSLWSLGLDLLSCIPKIVFAETIFLLTKKYIAFYTISRHITQYYTIQYYMHYGPTFLKSLLSWMQYLKGESGQKLETWVARWDCPRVATTHEESQPGFLVHQVTRRNRLSWKWILRKITGHPRNPLTAGKKIMVFRRFPWSQSSEITYPL